MMPNWRTMMMPQVVDDAGKRWSMMPKVDGDDSKLVDDDDA